MGGVLLAHGPAMAAGAEDAKTDAKYCGISYLGSHASSPTISPIKSKLDNKEYLGNLGKRMRGMAQPTLIGLNLLDSNSTGTNTALTFMFSAARHDQQKYSNPLEKDLLKREQFFNIFTVQVQTIFFNADNYQVQGIYPWTFRYSAKSEKPLTKEDVEAQFAALLDADPQQLEDGESQPAEVMLYHWADGLGGIRANAKDRTLSVAPIQFSEHALQVLTNAASVEENPAEKMARVQQDLRNHFESELSRNLKLPVVPGGGDKFVLTLGDCAKNSNGEQEIVLPTPTYRFVATVEELASGNLQTESKRQVLVDGGQLIEQSIKQTEVAYGARFKVGLFRVEDAVSDDGAASQKDTIMLDNQFRYYSAIKYSGDRKLSELEQYDKLGLSFFGNLTDAYINRDEKWVKNHLSAERNKDKPSTIVKEWDETFGKKIGVQKPKKRA